MSLFKELKRRNVIRIAGIYAVVAWILMQVAGTLEDSLKLPEWFDSAVTAGLMIGFPIALLLAWAFEMTPEGVKRTEELADGETIASSKMDGLILVGIVVVIGLGVWQQLSDKELGSRLRGNDEVVNGNDGVVVENNENGEKTSVIPNKNSVIPAKAGIQSTDEIIQPNSIAVLPFADLSPNNDQEYFSDGMAEEILNVLVQVKQLKVASRTSAFGFKGQESLGIPNIAKKLKVWHILEGSVRKSGENIRITAQLIDAKNDKHLWSQTFDRTLTTENIFAIQDEIAKAIVDKLGIALDIKNSFLSESTTRIETQNIAAYELYLKARALFQDRIELDKADEYLIKALEKDDAFSQAWELRAALQSLLKSYDFSTTPFEKILEDTERYAKKALLHNSNSSLAMAASAYTRQNYGWVKQVPQDYKQIINDLEKAIGISPNQTSPINWLGMAYLDVGELEKALHTFRSCIEIDPFFAPCRENEYDILSALGRDEEAWDRFSIVQGQGISTNYLTSFILLAKHNERIAFLLMINTPEKLLGWKRQEEVYNAYQNLDQDHTALLKDILQFIKLKHGKVSGSLKLFLMPLGVYEYTPESFLMWDVAYKKYRQSKYFKKQIKGSGVFNYWQKHGYPPQCRPIGEDDFECD